MSSLRIRKLKPTSWKEPLRKEKSAVATPNTITPAPFQTNWKTPLKQKIGGTTNISTPSPAHTAYLRAEYLKKGHLTNAHKKYINTVSSQTVVTKGCSGCGKSIKNT
jgi:hypothetical protein